MALSSYNIDPALNSSIGGADISEGCNPDQVNNAIRQIMADLATFNTTDFNRAITVPLGEVGSNVPTAVNRASKVLLFDSLGNAGASAFGTIYSGTQAVVADDRTILANMSGVTVNQAVFLTEPGREGLFKYGTKAAFPAWSTDTYQGLYVASTIDSTKVWVRVFQGDICADWFGTVHDRSGVTGTDDAARITAALRAAEARLGGNVKLGPYQYLCSTVLYWNAAPVSLIGSGASSQAGVGTVLYFPNSATQIGCVNPRNGPAGKGARSRARDFVIEGANGAANSAADMKLGKGSGLLAQCNTGMFDNVIGKNLEGHAHYAMSAYPTDDSSINCNGSVFYCCTGADCKGAARAAYGVDSNQVIFIGGGGSHCAHNLYDNSLIGVVEFAALSEGSSSYDWRFGDIARESRVYAAYREINTHNNIIQFEAGGSGNHKVDLRHAEGTSASPATFTITDSTASPYLNEVTLLGVLGAARWGFGNGGEGTINVSPSGDLNVIFGKKITFRDEPLTATAVLHVVAGKVQLEHGAGPMLQIANDGPSLVLDDGKAYSSGAFDTPSVYKVNNTQVVMAQRPAIGNPSGGTVIDVEARAALIALMNTLRSGAGQHGLVLT